MATRRVERFDRLDLSEEGLAAPHETPEGFLVVEAFVSRPGIYRYTNTREDEADGLGPAGSIRLELRPESEVFSKKSIATYRSRSITVGHPRKNGKRVRVDASNVRDFEVGVVEGSARRVGDKLAASLLIKDKAAIAEVKAKKKRQLSPGHLTELVVEKGVDPKYGRYDAIQTDIEINHLALVEKARGGDALKMRLDGEELREDYMGGDEGKLTTTEQGHAHLVCMTDWDGSPRSSGVTSEATTEGEAEEHSHAWVKNPDGTIAIAASGGHTHELAPTQSDTLVQILSPSTQRSDGLSHRSDSMADKKSREDELTERVQELEGEVKTLEKERDGLRVKMQERLDAAEAEAVKKAVERADAAEARLDEYRGSFTKQVRAFATLQSIAKSVMGDTYRCDDKDDVQIMSEVVKRLDSSIDVVNTPAAELRGHFKQLVARHDRAKREYHDAAEIIGDGSRSAARAEVASKKLDDEWDNKWKQPPASAQMLRKDV